MRPALEVADIFRRHGEAFRAAQRSRLLPHQRRVMAAIEACRTAALGGHVEQCDDCGKIRIAYNSCRDRHCPKCQGLARAQWLADRRPNCCQFPISMSFSPCRRPSPRSPSRTRRSSTTSCSRPRPRRSAPSPPIHKHLGAETGMIAILHTWGQTLTHHPHVHCIVPGGGLGPDGRWVACRPGFFLPVHVLSRSTAACSSNVCRRPSTLASWRSSAISRISASRRPSRSTRAVAQRRLGRLRQAPVRRARTGTRLSRSLHPSCRHRQRPSHRLRGRPRPLPLEGYRAHNKPKVMTLDADEFMRRFLLHVCQRLPPHPSLRLPGQRLPRRQAGRLRAALTCLSPRRPSNHRLSRTLRDPHRPRIDICPCCGGHMAEIGLWPRSPPPAHATM